MNAEIGIDAEGRAYLTVTPANQTEWHMLRYMKSYLPLKIDEASMDGRLVGERLPGSGKGG